MRCKINVSRLKILKKGNNKRIWSTSEIIRLIFIILSQRKGAFLKSSFHHTFCFFFKGNLLE